MPVIPLGAIIIPIPIPVFVSFLCSFSKAPRCDNLIIVGAMPNNIQRSGLLGAAELYKGTPGAMEGTIGHR